jgi:hypothetical protein
MLDEITEEQKVVKQQHDEAYVCITELFEK